MAISPFSFCYSGQMNAASLSTDIQDAHALFPRICEYVTLYDKGTLPMWLRLDLEKRFFWIILVDAVKAPEPFKAENFLQLESESVAKEWERGGK